jgi:prepilin-type N-terminal cleavage/methylation domain-containing protein
MTTRLRNAFTLVELLVVIAIIGVLVALLLPAVQAAREAARRSQCSNQLRQVALAWQLHHDAHEFFPSGGWGYHWTGDPNRGFGKKQPGSWAYSCLPFMEAGALHQRGKGASGTVLRDILTEVAQTPVATFYCPSRRPAVAYNNADPGAPNRNFGSPPTLARIDYAANLGPRTTKLPGDPSYPEQYFTQWGPGPQLAEADDETKFMSAKADLFKYCQGVVFQRSEINLKHITDGASNTYMIGEKYLNPRWYDGGQSSDFSLKDIGDDQGAFIADDLDANRNTGPDLRDPRANPADVAPTQDQEGLGLFFNFGGSHPGSFQMAMCDASVRGVSYTIDPLLNNQLGTRAGDEPVSSGQ